jgi:SSS family solute:Na+ symporter
VMGVQAIGGWQGLATPPPAAGFEELGRAWFNPITRAKVGGSDLFALGNVIVAWVIMAITWHFAMQSTAQRVLSARDPGTARRGCFLAAVLLVPLAGCVVASGMAARILHPGLEAPGGIEQVQALPALIQNLLSPGLAGIVLAALVAVIMSTSDSALLGASTILVRDLAPGLLRGREERASIRLLGGTTILLGALAVGAALVAPTLVRMLELVAAVYCVSLFVPMIAGLYWRRASEAGALAAMVLSGGAGVLWRALGYEAETKIHMLVLALPLAIIGMIGISLVFPDAGGTSAGPPTEPGDG